MNRENAIAILLLTVLVFVFPQLTTDNYFLTVGIFIGINAIVAIGLTILMGYAGQISLGQAGFYGIGAYVSAILSLTYGLPVMLSIITAIAVASIAATLLAIPSLRLKGHYLAVATLGFGEIIHIILNEWGPGGPSGFGDIPHFSIFGYTLQSTVEYFYLIWICIILIMIFSLNLLNSMTGKTLRAIHDSEIATLTLGINITFLKIKVFVLSAVYASLAGALYAHYVTFLSPSGFSLFYSVLVLMMVVIGGISNIWGGIAGAIIITILPEVLRGFKEFDILMYGLILTLSLLFMRRGIVPMVIDVFRNKFLIKIRKNDA
ncbi:branched-chain amino acid ABC transporter permease [Thermodesulfovibrio sp.]|uniref:branched-chain amino acid ABC transporter permease n=1 Tax=Thermodesulfovibrio sp. TaxID=2067987 RepID=UPI00309E5054